MNMAAEFKTTKQCSGSYTVTHVASGRFCEVFRAEFDDGMRWIADASQNTTDPLRTKWEAVEAAQSMMTEENWGYR